MHTGSSYGPMSSSSAFPARPVAAPEVTDEGKLRPTRSLIRAIALIAIILFIGVVMGRAEFVVVAVPFIVGTALHMWNVPRHMLTATVELDNSVSQEGDGEGATLTLNNPTSATVAAHVKIPADKWLKFRHGTNYLTALPPDTERTRRLHFDALRWGKHSIGPLHVRMIAAGGLLHTRVSLTEAMSQQVQPDTLWTDFNSDLPKAIGFVGVHRSRRHGDAAELAEVRHFQPGDRLRRIDWRTSARSRDLYVNATESERDADVSLVLDLTHEVGESGGINGQMSALDTTVRAAMGVADQFIQQGDQVSVFEFSAQPRKLRAGSGQRQRAALAAWITGISVPDSPLEVSARRYLAMMQPHQGLHIVLTPFLTPSSLQLIGLLNRMGRPVTCINTLPAGIEPMGNTDWAPQALRIWRLERESLFASVAERGVRVLHSSDLMDSSKRRPAHDLVA